jgi:hypothetical protein
MKSDEELYEESIKVLEMAVAAGKMGIFVPETLRVLVHAGATVLAMSKIQSFRDGVLETMREDREAAPVAPVIDLFGTKQGGQS